MFEALRNHVFGARCCQDGRTSVEWLKNHLKSPLRLSSKSLTHIQAGNHDTKATNPKSRKMTDEIRCRKRSDLFANLPTVYFVLNTISLTPETKNALIENRENDFTN